MGSLAELLIGLVPKQNTNLLISETRILLTTVGTLEAPANVVSSTARVARSPLAADASQ